MSAPGNVSMLPTLFPPMPVPTKVSTRVLGARPSAEVGEEVVDDVAGAAAPGEDGPDDGPHPHSTAAAARGTRMDSEGALRRGGTLTRVLRIASSGTLPATV